MDGDSAEERAVKRGVHAYPQLLAVRAAKRLSAMPVLRRAVHSKSPVVAEAAREAVSELLQ
jgi:hypothetical protein